METKITGNVVRVKSLDNVVFATLAHTYQTLGVDRTCYLSVRAFEEDLMILMETWKPGDKVTVLLKITPDLRQNADGSPAYDRFQFLLLDCEEHVKFVQTKSKRGKRQTTVQQAAQQEEIPLPDESQAPSRQTRRRRPA